MIPVRFLNAYEREAAPAAGDLARGVIVDREHVLELVRSYREANKPCGDCGAARREHTASASCHGFRGESRSK